MSPCSRQLLLGASVATAVFLAGCQSIPPAKWTEETRGTIDATLDQAKGRDAKAAVPSDVSKGLLPPLEIGVPDGRKTVEPRFDLSVANAPARQVFMGLVEGTPYDIVLQADVSGTVSLNLKDVTVSEALKALRDAYGYEFRRDGNRYVILGREMQTRLFNVNYLNLTRSGKSDTRVTASGLTSTGATSGGTTTTSTSQSGVQVTTVSLSDFWKELRETLAVLIGCSLESKTAGTQNKREEAGGTTTASITPNVVTSSPACKGGRNLVVNAQTGLVAVRAMPSELRVVEEYLGTTHAMVNRQVVLEAKIVDVELNDRFQSGINWAKIHGSYTFGQTGGGTSLTGSGIPGVSDIAGNAGDLNPGGAFSGISGTTASAFGGIFSLAAKTDNFAAFVELLKTQGDVQVLSSPRISTMNNQKAIIKVGTDAFFVTKQDVTLSQGASQVTSELTPFFSGISLDVTPQIDENGAIMLHIHPAVSNVTEKKIVTGRISGTTSNNEVSTALSAVQESDNIVRASSGQIIVIGGLIKEGTTDENSSVPFLGDIPLIGNLFKHKRVTRIKKELVILLKPTVIQLDQDWNKAVDESHERIKKIRIGS